jgi:hypothetical protein
MQLEYAALVLYDGWFISYQTGKELQIERQPNEILDLLCRAAPGSTVEINNQVRSELAQSLQENGIQMEMGDHVQFIIPLHGSRDLLGVFVLGNKIGVAK